jgi:hypothetical protein
VNPTDEQKREAIHQLQRLLAYSEIKNRPAENAREVRWNACQCLAIIEARKEVIATLKLLDNIQDGLD